MTTTYVTVAIPYVNADPHLGYAYELVQADVFARARRAAGSHVRFLGGTDDHSLKNVLAAEAAGVSTRRFVDDHAGRFQALARALGLSFDDFIRTSADSRHAPAVHRLWRAAADGGHLYRRRYEGDYCIGCEQFYDPSEQVAGRCPEHTTPVERVTEENWFFRLSAHQDHLEDLIASDRLAIRPEAFRREVLAFIRAGLRDISVSRSVQRARGWGVPVPDDAGQVVYVWFDALTSYISALGFGDPRSADHRRWWIDADERVHVIGKGILRFHAVYWPAFLAAAGQPPPTRIQVHPHLTVGGRKLSKSGGVIVSPVDVAERYGTDALRWFFAREVSEVADTDFTPGRLVARANDDLARGLGNVTHRIASLLHRHGDGRSPGLHVDPIPAVAGLASGVAAALADFRLRAACDLVLQGVAALNRDLEASQPWKAASDPARAAEVAVVLARQAATARVLSRLAAPVVPELSARLVAALGSPDRPVPDPVPVVPLLE